MEYALPDTGVKEFLTKILDVMRGLPLMLPFEYEFAQQDPLKLTLTEGDFQFTLREFQKMEKYFYIHECCVLLFRCLEATQPLAEKGLFFGGYSIDDFVFRHVEYHFVVFVRPNVPKILSFLTGKCDYFTCACRPPELDQGIYSEKADIWSLGVIYKTFLSFYQYKGDAQCSKQCENDTPEYISNTMHIYDMNAIQIMSKLLNKNYLARPGYDAVFEGLMQMKSKCQNKDYCFIGQALKSASFDSYLAERGLKLLYKLGQGTFGEVFLVENSDGELTAVKFVQIKSQLDMNKYSSEALNTFNAASAYVIQLLDVNRAYIEQESYLAIQLEYAPYGDLRNFLYKYFDQLSLRYKLSLASRIAIAIYHLHGLGVVHRDIKPENVLIARDFVPKLSDFGSNELLFDGEASSKLSGSFGYLAPEVIRGEKATEKVDVWSFGIMFYEILFGERPEDELLYCGDATAQAVLDGCLQEDVARRLSSEQVASMLRAFEGADFSGLQTAIRQQQFEPEASASWGADELVVARSFTFSKIPSLKV